MLLRLSADYRELKSVFNHLSGKHDKLESRMKAMESSPHDCHYNLIDGDNTVEIIPGSKIFVSESNLRNAKKCEKVSRFAARMFAELCTDGVSDVPKNQIRKVAHIGQASVLTDHPFELPEGSAAPHQRTQSELRR